MPSIRGSVTGRLCLYPRFKSTFSNLLFDRKQDLTRPLITEAVLDLPVDTAARETHIKVKLGSSQYELPNIFLRDSCMCHKCVDPSSTQKSFNTGDLDPATRPSALRVINNSLEIIWEKDNHRSVFPARFLANYATPQTAISTRFDDRLAHPWNKNKIQSTPISTDFKKYMSTDASVHEVVENLANYGIAFIENCPAGPQAEGVLKKITERVGPLKNTFYGPTWNVRSVQDAKNVAYTSTNLDLHMDLLYYESPPGLQFLHCLENQVPGGSSVFVDSFAIAEKMRTDFSVEFDVLCSYKVDFKYENDGLHYHQSRPTIVLNEDTKAIEYVNYSPPFQGILNPEGVQEYHRAISIFAKLIAANEARHELVLREGQCVVFNNRRTLHARRAFGAGKRWLKGSYTDIDALWSKYRTGKAELARH